MWRSEHVEASTTLHRKYNICGVLITHDSSSIFLTGFHVIMVYHGFFFFELEVTVDDQLFNF